jgi:hypothetical protein
VAAYFIVNTTIFSGPNYTTSRDVTLRRTRAHATSPTLAFGAMAALGMGLGATMTVRDPPGRLEGAPWFPAALLFLPAVIAARWTTDSAIAAALDATAPAEART